MSSSLSAIVVAGGSSSRFSAGQNKHQNKQFVEWNFKPLFVHTLEGLFAALDLQETVLVVNASLRASFEDELLKYGMEARVKIAIGGARRQDSVRAGIEALAPVDRVFIHDSARPFLEIDFLKSLEEASRSFDAIIPTLPMVETLKEVDASGQIKLTHDRSKFVRVQTPQFFKMDVIKKAHEEFKTSAIEFTDDAAMVEAMGGRVQTFPGRAKNVKVTTVEDLRGIVQL